MKVFFKKSFLVVLLIMVALFLQHVWHLDLTRLPTTSVHKNPSKLKYYACLFRDNNLKKDEFCQLFEEPFYISHRIDQASESFNIPYSVLFCTVLIESGFDYKSKHRIHYGYGQLSHIAIEQLRRVYKSDSKYQMMWGHYHDRSFLSIAPQKILFEKTPTLPIGTIAFYVRWMFDRIDRLECSGCGPSFLVTEKKVALMIAGYNWKPFSIHNIDHLSIKEMTSKENMSLPSIPKRYIQSMRRCRHHSMFHQLRQGQPVQDHRKKACRSSPCDSRS